MSTVNRVLPWRRHHETFATSELTPLLASYRRRHPKARVDTINRAYHMAAEAHRSQTRSSGESYINHPLAVAKIVADIGLDETSLAAALLHDAVEDTEITLSDVEQHFGSEVAWIVDGVTKLERIQFDSREAQQAATMRKMLVAMAKDLRVLMIKLADRELGSVTGRRVHKSLTDRDRRRLAAAAESSTEILARFGVRRESIFRGMLTAGHPGGMLPLTGLEREPFHAEHLASNLYVADASLFPMSLGKPPMLTIMALAKRVARLCMERFA